MVAGSAGAAVPGDVPGAAAGGADDGGGDVGLVGTEPGLVVGGGAVGAARGVVLPQRAVELRQLAELHPAEVVLTFRHLHALADHFFNLSKYRFSCTVVVDITCPADGTGVDRGRGYTQNKGMLPS